MSKTNALQKVGHKDGHQGQRFYNVTRVFDRSSPRNSSSLPTTPTLSPITWKTC